MHWIDSSETKPCPVCGRTHDADCQIAVDGLTVLCHTRTHPGSKVSQPADETNGFKFTGKIETNGVRDRAVYTFATDPFQKPVQPKSETFYYYPTLSGDDLIRVKRVDFGNGQKTFSQHWWNGEQWIIPSKKQPDSAIPETIKAQIHLYKITESLNQKAIQQGTKLLLVEGEALVDRLLALGIPATSAIGGGKSWAAYGGKHGNYQADLKNAIQESLVICPDRDKDGIARGLQVASFFPHAQWLYANPEHYAWSNPELGSGYDLGNWLDELTAQGKDEDELFNTVMGAVEKTARTFKPLPEVESRPKAVETQQQLKPNFESKPDSDYPHFTDLEPLDEVKNTTIDDHVFKRIFEAGKGDYKVINSAFYKYTGAGYWAHIDDEVVEQTIAKYTRNAYKAKRNERGEVVAINFPYAKTGNVSSAFSFSRTLLSSTQNTPYNRHLLCFKNCTVDLRTGDILEHNQDDILTSTIAADYEPGLPCPDAFGEFVYGAFGEDIFEVIQAVTSMLLDPTAPYGQFPHLIGPSGSGKGTLMSVWEEMYSQDNVRSAASLSELSTPEGRYQNLMGTSLFKCPDIGGYQQGLRAFYGLVDNEPMSARPLFSKRNIQVQFNTRFAIGSVQPLQIENSGDGWDRRVIPLPTKERRGGMDRYLKLKLKEVLPQIISWALSMTRQRRDFILSNLHFYERIEAARGDAALAGDPIRSFVDMCLRPAPESKKKIDSCQLHTWYSAYVQVMGSSRMSLPRFVNHLKTIIPHHYQPRRRGSKKLEGHTDRILAHWSEIEPLDGVFQEENEAGDFCKCIKKECEDGGLWAFSDYAATLSDKPMTDFDSVPQRPTSLAREKTIRDTAKAPSGNGSASFVPHVPHVPHDFEQTEKMTEKGRNEGQNAQKSDLHLKNMLTPPPHKGHEGQNEKNCSNPLLEGVDFVPHEKDLCGTLRDIEGQKISPTYTDDEDEEWAKGKPEGYTEEF